MISWTMLLLTVSWMWFAYAVLALIFSKETRKNAFMLTTGSVMVVGIVLAQFVHVRIAMWVLGLSAVVGFSAIMYLTVRDSWWLKSQSDYIKRESELISVLAMWTRAVGENYRLLPVAEVHELYDEPIQKTKEIIERYSKEYGVKQ